ncbi:helix-turn-helix transcriptional regulator [Sphaerisporangium sp. B11E5]|uniref:PadR family transcriptional regulator n=1 Tax=Sphaerisporangium sp. B11E5 TaxID=3153563 RepID=UPI00325DBBC0
MAFPSRVTASLLKVLAVFIQAFEDDTGLHGWAIKKAAGLSGAATYKMLDRLEDAGWVAGQWEPSPEAGKPQRRVYRLTPTGERAARAVLSERWPEALARPSGARGVPRPEPLTGFFGDFGLPGDAR